MNIQEFFKSTSKKYDCSNKKIIDTITQVFKAEVDTVRKWVIECGFSLTTHAYDFMQKKIVEVDAPLMTPPVRKPIII